MSENGIGSNCLLNGNGLPQGVNFRRHNSRPVQSQQPISPLALKYRRYTAWNPCSWRYQSSTFSNMSFDSP